MAPPVGPSQAPHPSGRAREFFATRRVVPVCSFETAKDAVRVANALLRGGVAIVEVTLRTGAALEAVRAIRGQVPGMCVGVGTVVRSEQLDDARAAGASFAMSPGATPRLLEAAKGSALVFVPGVATTSEALQANEFGFDAIKVFPANLLGGVAFAKALGSVLPDLALCPTGGLDDRASAELLRLPNVVCVGGSSWCPAAAIEAGDDETIERRAREAVALQTAAGEFAVDRAQR